MELLYWQLIENTMWISIKILRNPDVMSQTTLAEKIGKTRGLVSHIERPDKVITALKRYCYCFKHSIRVHLSLSRIRKKGQFN